MQNKESKEQPFRTYLPVNKNAKKSGEKGYLIYNIVSLGKIAAKTGPFS